ACSRLLLRAAIFLVVGLIFLTGQLVVQARHRIANLRLRREWFCVWGGARRAIQFLHSPHSSVAALLLTASGATAPTRYDWQFDMKSGSTGKRVVLPLISASS